MLATLDAERPEVFVIDSVQTLHASALTGAAGSVGQVREVADRITRLAKARGMAVLLVGHVTKEGALAGPRVLEHLVDCVLQFEGERERTYRTLRALKNRFGNNTLVLQAFEGALLGPGVGDDNITNITRITHSTDFDPCFFFGDNCVFNPMQDDLTVDMARSGSATELELAGGVWEPFDFGLGTAVDVDVTNLENDDTVIFSGTHINILTLDHVSGGGTFNLVMAQDPCVENFLPPVR